MTPSPAPGAGVDRSLINGLRLLGAGAAIALGAFHLWSGYSGGLPFIQQRVVHLALSLVVIWLTVLQATRLPRRALQVAIAIPFLLISVALLGYLFVNDDELLTMATFAPTPLLIWAAVATAFTLETTRRVAGISLPLMVVGLGLIMLSAGWLPFATWFAPTNIADIVNTIAFSDHGLIGPTTGVSAGVVAGFLVFGSFLGASGGAQGFLNLARFLVGRFRGGPAKVSLVTSALFGTVSGSAVANVVVDGVFNIPLMKRSGYSPQFAAAVEATASTGGQIVPPVMGAAAFIMAQFLELPYATIVVAAILPAFLYYLALFVSVHIEALKLGLPAMPKDQLPRAGQLLTRDFVGTFVLPIAVLLALMYTFGRSLLFASFGATLVIIAYMLLDRRSPLRARFARIIEALRSAGHEISRIAAIIVCAQIFVTLLGISGLGPRVANEVAGIDIALELALLALAGVIVVLGFGAPTSAAYILAASIASPIFRQIGIDPLAGHFFILYLAVFSAISPPVMPAVFAAAGIARASMMAAGMTAMRLLTPALLIPFVFVLEPSLLLRGGEPVLTAYAVIRLGVGIIAVAAGLARWFGRPLPAWSGVLLVIGGYLFAWPTNASTIAGLVLIGIGLAPLASARYRSTAVGGRTAYVTVTDGRSTEISQLAFDRLVAGMRSLLLERGADATHGLTLVGPLTLATVAAARAAADLGVPLTSVRSGGVGPQTIRRAGQYPQALAIVPIDVERQWLGEGIDVQSTYDARLAASRSTRASTEPPRSRGRVWRLIRIDDVSLEEVDLDPATWRAQVRAVAAAFRILPTDRLLISGWRPDVLMYLVLEAALAAGAAVVLDERETHEPAELLRVIAETRVSSVALPQRALRELVAHLEQTTSEVPASLSAVIHDGPCDAELKQRAIAAFGPILIEFYLAADRAAGTAITSEEWLDHVGSVGRGWAGLPAPRVLDAAGSAAPAGERGRVAFETAGGLAVTDDLGWLDKEGYLFIDRAASLAGALSPMGSPTPRASTEGE